MTQNTGDPIIKEELVSMTCPCCEQSYTVKTTHTGTGDVPACPKCGYGNQRGHK
jgi:Zn finger protein HypA/HybF involved in hydrogenase expression